MVNDGKIVINNLQEGLYRLNIKEFKHIIEIEVIKGEYWKENGIFIVDDRDNVFTESIGS